MITNYLKVAIRNISRSPGYSFINIAGLAIGMTVTTLIGLWVYDEVSFNHYHKNYERIGEVYQHVTSSEGEILTFQNGCGPLGAELAANYGTDFKQVIRMWWESNHILSIGDQKTSQNGTFMDQGALEMLTLEMEAGDWSSLNNPSSIVLSASTARTLFGNDSPINQMIRLDNEFDVKVSGVYRDIPENSRFHNLKFIGSWDYWVASNPWMKAEENNWNGSLVTLVQLQPNATFEGVSEKIADIKRDHISKEEAVSQTPQFFVQPMSRWHLYSEWENGKEVRGRIQFVWLFAIVAVFVLLLACINFMNLSTARSEKRAKEVGIRKSIGSARYMLVNQFLSESFLIVWLSWFMSMAIVGAVLPWFNNLAGKEMSLPLSEPVFWVASLAFIVFTSLVSGSYPALFLSSFQPVRVLKGTFKAGRYASLPRKALVVLQFTTSIILVVGTTVVWQQVQFAKNRPIGYSREGLIMIRKTAQDHWMDPETLRQELLDGGGAVDVAQSAAPPTAVWFENSGFNWEGKDPNMRDDFVNVSVSPDYGRTMGWEFVRGRDFSRDHSTDSLALVLNETAVAYMGLDDPIDQEVRWQGRTYHVIGVIKDMIMNSPYEPVKQSIFRMIEGQGLWINIRLNPELGTSAAVSRVEKVFQKLMPAVPFEYTFIDQEYALKFAGEERIGKLANFFASLAIFISCLGLFGMASFVAEQRRKEIGIRKILGATVFNLWRMLSLEFITLVGISCLIGIPIAWNYLVNWLDNYYYHTNISIWVFILASAGALLITLATVSFQTIKAAIVNPVQSLRSE